MVSVKSTFAEHNQKHTKIFTLDTSIDLSKVVFGLPMLAEKKSVESYKFTASYFAPVTNTRIIFVSSKDPETQVKYGISNDGQYIIKSDNPNPIILENVGHYEITFDLLMGTYDIKALDKKASQFEEMYFVLLGRIIRQCRSLTLRMLLQFGRLIIIYLEVVLMYLW